MNRNKKLLFNSVVFAFGNLGSKLITFLMVPLYTRYLSTEEYGTTDIITTVVQFLTPILTLSIIDGVFRFAMSKNNDDSEVLTNGFVVSIASIVILICFLPLIVKIRFGAYIVFITYLGAIEAMIQQFARGIGKSVLYATTGIVMTVVTVLSNLLLLVGYKLGMQGYLISIAVAQIVGIIFLVVTLQMWKYVKIKLINKKIILKMLGYSIPLIPNTVSWWISSSANKLFIGLMLGAAANGIYAVANKIPSLISVVYNIFTQAWQISVIEEFKKRDANVFFSVMLNNIISLMLVGVAVITLFSKLLVRILATPPFYSAWNIVPWLAFAVLFSSVSSFLGTMYTASMKTSALFTTTIVGAIVNICANLALIPIFNLSGAGIGSAFSFAFVAWLRLIDLNKTFNLKVDWKRFLASLLLVVIEIIFVEFVAGIFGTILAALFALFAMVCQKDVIGKMVMIIVNVSKRKLLK